MQDFKGKVAVITGGTSGIGFGIAKELAKQGCKLVLVGMNQQKAEAAAQILIDAGAEAIGLRCDVSNKEQVESLVEAAYGAFSKVDILINNAGVGQVGPLHLIEEEDWDWIMNVNVKSIFLVSSAFIRRFLDRGDSAVIVNTGSETCFGLNGTALGSMFPYVASKHAILGLTEVMQRDYAPHGIQVSVMCPGPVATEIWNSERSRQADFGNGNPADPKLGEILHQLGMDPAEVGRMTVAGIRNGDYYIITHSNIRELVEKRYREASAALDKTDAWHKANSVG